MYSQNSHGEINNAIKKIHILYVYLFSRYDWLQKMGKIGNVVVWKGPKTSYSKMVHLSNTLY